MAKLIERVDHTLHGQYVADRYKNRNIKITKTPYEVAQEMCSVQPMFGQKTLNHDVQKSLKSVDAIPMDLMLQNVPHHFSVSYLHERNIPEERFNRLWFIKDEEKLENLSPKYEGRIAGNASRILFPFCDRNKKLLAVSGRALDDKSLRYLMVRLADDAGPLIYGLDFWDSTQTTYVVEGPFDSLFLPNALAAGGTDLQKVKDVVPQDNAIIVFDNQPRNVEVCYHMEKAIEDGWTICIWPKKVLEKDINDMINAGEDVGKVLDTLNSNSFSGMKAKMAMSKWRKC